MPKCLGSKVFGNRLRAVCLCRWCDSVGFSEFGYKMTDSIS